MDTLCFEYTNLNRTDSELLERLFLSEYKDLVDYTRFIVYCKDWAEDIVQEAFMIGIEKISDLRDSKNQVGWMYRTVQNIVLNRNREFMRLNELIQKVTVASDHETAGVEPPFEPQILFDEGYKDLLKKSDWEILKDYYCNGYQYKELSKKYGKSVSACKMQVLRAKTALAKKLRGNFQ